jgi:DNA-binding beta-propeller fold protein YncE
VQIYGYGFGTDPTKISVKIGGATATVQKVENVTTVTPSLALDVTYPFPLERITLQTPAGSPGKPDIFISAPSGSATSSKAFQYLQSVHSYPKAALFKFLIYDQPRQRIYLSNIDHVDAFDLQENIFLSPINPTGGPPANAGLRGLALTPGGSQLIVADFGAQNVYLLDPVNGSGTTVFVGGVSGFTNSGPARVAATSLQTVLWDSAARADLRDRAPPALPRWTPRLLRPQFNLPGSLKLPALPARHFCNPAQWATKSFSPSRQLREVR